jgi:hypothetical protein
MPDPHSSPSLGHLGTIEEVLHNVGRVSHQVNAAIEELAQHSRGGREYHRIMVGLDSRFKDLRELLDQFDRFRDEYERAHSDPA